MADRRAQHGQNPPIPKAASRSGYALLLVFLMAAMIALALYRELPRVAFEAQRSKEEMLIERGEQYKRAIQLFVRKVGRYPATIDELESLNNIRFLRKRYLDPMTGREKWRLIHINGGVLTDSVVQKGKLGQGQQPPANTNTFIAEGPVMGATNSDPAQQLINRAMQRRASDDRPVVTQEAPGASAQPDADQDGANENGGDSTTDAAPGAPAAVTNAAGMPNQPASGVVAGRFPQPGMYPGQPGYNPALANQPPGPPGAWPSPTFVAGANPGPNNGGQSGSGSSVYVAPTLGQSSNQDMVQMERMLHGDYQPPGFPRPQPNIAPPQPVTSQPAAFQGQAAAGFGQAAFGQTAFGQAAFGASSSGPTGQNPVTAFGGSNPGLTSAANMQAAGALPGMGGAQIGGGIAGVASESTGPAIKVYNERKKYNEWEFVYDQSKDRGLAGMQRNGGGIGTAAQAMGSIPSQPPGISGPGGASGIGGQAGISNSSFGNSSGFGLPVSPQPQAQQQQAPN